MKFKGNIIIADPYYLEGVSKKFLSKFIIKSSESNRVFKTYIINGNPKEYVDDWYQFINYDYLDCPGANIYLGKEIGTYFIQSGIVGVFLLNEVLSSNPYLQYWIKEHRWYVSIIKNFDGNIDCYNTHIIGQGNINFYIL